MSSGFVPSSWSGSIGSMIATYQVWSGWNGVASSAGLMSFSSPSNCFTMAAPIESESDLPSFLITSATAPAWVAASKGASVWSTAASLKALSAAGCKVATGPLPMWMVPKRYDGFSMPGPSTFQSNGFTGCVSSAWRGARTERLARMPTARRFAGSQKDNMSFILEIMTGRFFRWRAEFLPMWRRV